MNEENIDLQRYWSIIRRHKKKFILVFLIPLIISFIWTLFQKPLYGSSTTIIVETINPKLGSSYLNYDLKDAFKSAFVKRETIENLSNKFNKEDLEKSIIEVKRYSDRAIKVIVLNPEPEIASDFANALIKIYQKQINEAQKNEIDDTLKKIDEQINHVELRFKESQEQLSKEKTTSKLYNQMFELKNSLSQNELIRKQLLNNLDSENSESELEKIEKLISHQKSELEILEYSPELYKITQLEKQVKSNEESLQELIKQKEKTLLSASTPGQIVQILEKAIPSSKPDKTRNLKMLGLGLIASFLFSLLLYVLITQLNLKITDNEDLEKLLGVPILATIPKIHSSMHKVKESKKYPKSAIVEAYRTLRTNIKFVSKEAKTIAFVSPMAGAGKTLTVSNLGLMMNNTNDKVILIDVDLRKSNLHKMFKIERVPGLTDVLLGESKLSEAIHKIDKNLYVLPAGSEVSNPLKLLGSEKMDALIKLFNKNYDYILFDSVPALAVSDAELIASKIDATIMIINASQTTRQETIDAKKCLDLSKANLIGTVFNNVDFKESYYGYYDY